MNSRLANGGSSRIRARSLAAPCRRSSGIPQGHRVDKEVLATYQDTEALDPQIPGGGKKTRKHLHRTTGGACQ